MKKILLLLLLCTAAFANGLPTSPYIYVQGLAEEQVAPDILTLTFSTLATDKDQVRAKALVSEKSTAIFKLFGQLGITDEAVAAHEISVAENYDYNASKRVFTGYTVTRNFKVRLTDFAAYPKLVDGLVELRIESVSGAQPTYSKAAEVSARLKKAALAQARQQADDLAAGMNARITGVFAASPIAFGEIPGAIFGGAGGGHVLALSAFSVKSEGRQAEDRYVFEKLTATERLHVIFLIEPGQK
jgi:uncharacterized protein YggE